jgi:hypothetical protein
MLLITPVKKRKLVSVHGKVALTQDCFTLCARNPALQYPKVRSIAYTV